MSPMIESVIAGVIANVITGITTYGARKGWETRPRRREELRRLLEIDGALGPLLQTAAASVGRSVSHATPKMEELIRVFLVSPDVEAILRQVYATSILDVPRTLRDDIRREFAHGLAAFLGRNEHDVASLAQDLFEALLSGCDRALSVGVDQGLLAAHEAKSAVRQRMLMDELQVIAKNVALLSGKRPPNVEAVIAFEAQYRAQVHKRYSSITPPHFDAARRLPIDDVYVSPSLLTARRTRTREAEVLTLGEFAALSYRSVILGKPGGGKSSLAQKLGYELSAVTPRLDALGRRVTPILVVLRDYSAERKRASCSIVEFIEATSNSSYQLRPPGGAGEYLMLNGHLLVIFDGLDELLDTAYRQTISQDIESFCSLYPAVPVIVTSREVGYEQAPLDEKVFEMFRLAEFDDRQVSEYVAKWFAVDLDLTQEQQQQKAAAFLEESRVVSDLRSNPLMLGLMCNIYRGENYIPRNRPDVYEKCALMLFERWDRSRGIDVPLALEAHVRPTMAYLAHWIYSDERLQGGVTEDRLVTKSIEYLCPRRFEDPDEAARESREFIAFCRGRAWVFTDTGTTASGEHLYQFTHRTFLEYFSALHLVRTYPMPERLLPVLTPHIARREWDVVAQLAFQIQNKQVGDAADELLAYLCRLSDTDVADEAVNRTSFAARALEFLIPSPRILREVIGACVQQCLRAGGLGLPALQRGRRRSVPAEEAPVYQIVGNLAWAAPENQRVISDTLERTLLEGARATTGRQRQLVFELGLHLTAAVSYRRSAGRTDVGVLAAWEGISDRVCEAYSAEIAEVARSEASLAKSLWWRGKASIEQLVEWHGIETLFLPSQHVLFPNTWWTSPAEWLIGLVIGAPYDDRARERFERRKDDIARVGAILLTASTPWVRTRIVGPGLTSFRWQVDQGRGETIEDPEITGVSGDVLFGVVSLSAVVVEAHPSGREELSKLMRESRAPLVRRMGDILLGPLEAEKSIEGCGLSELQREFVRRWRRQDIRLMSKKALRSVSADVAGEVGADEAISGQEVGAPLLDQRDL